MKRILLKISYDGTAYHGWQVQKNAVTVQEIVQDSLEKILKFRPDVTGCSRTDAGVHAAEFYCHFDCSDRIPDKAFLLGLNSVLPDDIAVLDCYEVSADFHARYNAEGKRYVYKMYCGLPNPFISRYAIRLESLPNIDLMNEFCKRIIGYHDFEGFSSSGKSVEDTFRTVTDCGVSMHGNLIEFSVSGDGFLYNMVRILAGTALEVGYNRLNVDCANDIFIKRERSLAGPTLPAKGLILDKVFYEGGE